MVGAFIVFTDSQNRPHTHPWHRPVSTPGLEPGHRASTLGSGEDVPHVARIPAATTRCCHASVVESVGNLLQRGRACLLHLLYDRHHCACEALGLGLASLATAAANGSEVGVAQLYTTRLGSCQRRLCTLRDQGALLLCQGRVDVQHERICIATERGHDERYLVRHKSGDEADVASQPI